MICSKCGMLNNDGSERCSECGAPLREVPNNSKKDNQHHIENTPQQNPSLFEQLHEEKKINNNNGKNKKPYYLD